MIVDAASGAVAQRMDFDEYGRVVRDTSPGFQSLGFAGGLYDPDTGLVRFGTRDYDPDTGRWTTKDVIGFQGSQSNLFAYVEGDPVNRIDPLGTDWWDVASDLAAGFGDHVSFGLTNVVRDWMGTNDVVNKCGANYGRGTAAGVAFDLLSAGGSMALKGAASNVTKTVLNADRKIARDVMNLSRGDGLFAHHINPLKGHQYVGGWTLFPTAGLPGWIKNSWLNLKVLNKAGHEAAHGGLLRAEAVARAMGLGNPGAAAARLGLSAGRGSDECSCP